MKKILYNLFIVGVILLLVSCFKEDKTIFDTSSSARVEADLMSYKAILTDAPYGWIMEYYPEKEERSMGGVLFCCRFSGDTAYLCMEHGVTGYPAGTVVPSLCQLKVEQGVLLSFNTYNPLLHLFGEPESSSNVEGYAGDYEFVIREADATTVTMTGKKWKNVCRLTRLEEPAADYLAKLWNMDEVVNELGEEVIKIKIGENSHQVNFSPAFSSRQLLVNLKTEANADSMLQVAWICTATSIKLYEPLYLDGVTITEFVPNESGTALVTPDGKVELVGPVTPYEKAIYLQNYFLVDRMDATLLAKFREAEQTNETANPGENITQLAIGLNPYYPATDKVYPQAVSMKSGKWAVTFGVNLEISDNQIDVNYLGLGFNAPDFYEHFVPWITYICDHSPYTITEENGDLCWKSNDGTVVFYTTGHPIE